MAPVSRRSVLPIVLTLISIIAVAREAAATSVPIDPGGAGTNFSYQYYDFGQLSGTPFDGSTRSIDIDFGPDFLVGGSFTIGLFFNQTGDLGTWPFTDYNVSGTLLDVHNNPIGAPTTLTLTSESPAQVWPGWPYSLPDGQPFFPATAGFEWAIAGGRIHGSADYDLIAPVSFGGIRLDVTYPNQPGYALLGNRLEIASHHYPDPLAGEYPIYVSPEHPPTFIVPVPDSEIPIGGVAATFILVLGTAAYWRRREAKGNC
jgi:hypothetical protein